MRTIAAIASLCLFTLAGCGSGGPEIVEIEGTVTRNGQPVPNLRIYFEPTKGRPSWAISDPSGHFKLDYDIDHDGALVGSHTVWVVDEGGIVDPTALAAGAPPPKRNPEIAQIIEKYGKLATSPKKVEITKADKNYKLELD
jgi:hypothetical protein